MRVKAEVGIITFHCSDNFGAMLQAYGLKSYLCNHGIDADIIRYEPLFLTGRHWWIPYIPVGGALGCFLNAMHGWRDHLCMKGSFFKARYNMSHFRKKYLIEGKQRKIVLPGQFKRLSYQYYIVGSDQIWNPDITVGLRNVYFGAFESRKKRKVIAYGASLGGEALDNTYDKSFSELLSHVDAISVREGAVIPYIKKFFKGDVENVLDPVFLLKKKEWIKIENQPDIERYILVYATEFNSKLVDYAIKLSQDKGLRVVELKFNTDNITPDFLIDYTAGPSEFLGYIHKAEYIVTNSFHAVAFSIIYQKKFIVFPHSSRSARLYNILQLHGLENRLWHDGEEGQIDSWIDWEEVINKTTKNVQLSIGYLIEHLADI